MPARSPPPSAPPAPFSRTRFKTARPRARAAVSGASDSVLGEELFRVAAAALGARLALECGDRRRALAEFDRTLDAVARASVLLEVVMGVPPGRSGAAPVGASEQGPELVDGPDVPPFLVPVAVDRHDDGPEDDSRG